MSVHRTTAIVLGLIMVLPIAANAQQQREAVLQPGDRIRVTASSAGLNGFVGRLAAVDTANRILSVEAEDTTIAVSMDALTLVQVARGEKSRKKSLRLGAGLGGLMGLAIGAAAGEDCAETEGLGGLAPCFGREGTAVLGGTIGLLVGGGIGYLAGGGTRWVSVPVQDLALIISPFGADGPAVMASITF